MVSCRANRGLKLGGFISIDRGDRSRASESFAEAIRELRGGSSAVVFPEGTRSSDGKLLPLSLPRGRIEDMADHGRIVLELLGIGGVALPRLGHRTDDRARPPADPSGRS